MKHYLNVYRTLLRINFSALVVYRTNFINNVLGSTVWGIFSIASIALLTAQTPTLFGWSRNEILLLSGVYSLFIGIFHTLFSRNFDRLSSLIRLGLLDSMLTKPIDSQFLVSMSIVNFASVIRIVLGAGFIWYIVWISHIIVNPAITVGFALGILIGLMLLYSLWFSVTTLIIWFPDLTNLVAFLYSYSNVGRYPREMYSGLNRFVFIFLLPLTFFVVAPTKILISRLTIYDVVGLLAFSVSFFVASRILWKYALRFYTSASN